VKRANERKCEVVDFPFAKFPSLRFKPKSRLFDASRMAHSYGDTRPSQGQQDSPRPASPVREEDALRRIEREAANVLRGYPVAAGLTSVADGTFLHLSPRTGPA